MSDHLLSAALLAFTLFAAHLVAAQARTRPRCSVDGGPLVTMPDPSLDLRGLARGWHTIKLEIP